MPEYTEEELAWLDARDWLFHETSKGGIAKWQHLANCLFFAIARHHDQDIARQIFDDCGPPPKRLMTALRNAAVLERLAKMQPKPNVAKLARDLAEENKKLPREQQRGAGGIDPITLEDFIRDLIKTAEKWRAGKIQGFYKSKPPGDFDL